MPREDIHHQEGDQGPGHPLLPPPTQLAAVGAAAAAVGQAQVGHLQAVGPHQAAEVEAAAGAEADKSEGGLSLRPSKCKLKRHV